MDGLLLDTERLALETFRAACEAHGLDPSVDVYHRCIGTRGERTREILLPVLGARLDDVMADWARRYQAHVLHRPVESKAGASDVLERLTAAGLPLAVATSTATAIARRKLELAGLADHFAALVGGDEVQHAKPHPEPYLEAARRLGVDARTCWAVEDSENGVRSALAAGCFVVQVPDLIAPNDAMRALGHVIVASLADLMPLLEAVDL